MEKKSFTDGVQFAWDSTSVELAMTCARKYYYTMIRGIKPKNKSVHLLFGGIYASALENFYKWRAEGDSIDEALRKAVHLALVESWDFETGQPMFFNDTKKTRVSLIRTIVWYVEQFGEESADGFTTFHLESGKPAVELSFAIEATPNIVLCGHLDRVVEFGGAKYVMDQKTTGSALSTYYFQQFDLSTQMSQYTWAGKIALSTPIRGVIIDAAQIAVNFSYFERGITTRSKDQIDEWFEAVIYHIEVAQHNTRANYFPQNFSSCDKYGGCPFKPLCTTSPGIRENYIKGDYEPHNWDPIKAR